MLQLVPPFWAWTNPLACVSCYKCGPVPVPIPVPARQVAGVLWSPSPGSLLPGQMRLFGLFELSELNPVKFELLFAALMGQSRFLAGISLPIPVPLTVVVPQWLSLQ